MTQSVISSVRIFRPSRVISAPVSAPVSSRQSVALSPSGPVKAAEDEAQYSIVPCVSAASMRCGAPQGESVSLRPASSERITPSNSTAVSPSFARTVMPETVSGAVSVMCISPPARATSAPNEAELSSQCAVISAWNDIRSAVSTVSANAFQFSVSRRAPQPVSSRGIISANKIVRFMIFTP